MFEEEEKTDYFYVHTSIFTITVPLRGLVAKSVPYLVKLSSDLLAWTFQSKLYILAALPVSAMVIC